MNMPGTQVSQGANQAVLRDLDALLPAGQLRAATPDDAVEGV